VDNLQPPRSQQPVAISQRRIHDLAVDRTGVAGRRTIIGNWPGAFFAEVRRRLADGLAHDRSPRPRYPFYH